MSAALVELFGATLATKGGTVSTSEALAGKQAIGIYFSAHWCPPCRGFTPKLAEWYSASLKAKGLEVVFVSSDRDTEAFNEYFGEQPWLALPFDQRDKKAELSKKFKVQGIPSFVIVDAEGKTITKDGREAVSSDPTGEDFPWRPVAPKDLLAKGSYLVHGEAGTKTIQDLAKGKKAVGLYFSAHWCPPCRGWTPKLAEAYTKDLKAKGLEVIFISWDRDESAFQEYFETMPWAALQYSDKPLGQKLGNAFGVEGIPTLVILDGDLNLISTDGREAVSQDPTGKELPWYPKPVKNLQGGPGDINEVPTVLAFVETNTEAEQQAAEKAMSGLGQELLDAAKAKEESSPEINFMIATSSGGLAGKIRSMINLPALPPSKHPHKMEKQAAVGGWGCDGCGNSGNPATDRYRCTQGCDFDYCGTCMQKVDAPAEALKPRLVLIDIPDDGGYYHGPEGEITDAVVRKFVEDYKEKKLTRQQLGR